MIARGRRAPARAATAAVVFLSLVLGGRGPCAGRVSDPGSRPRQRGIRAVPRTSARRFLSRIGHTHGARPQRADPPDGPTSSWLQRLLEGGTPRTCGRPSTSATSRGSWCPRGRPTRFRRAGLGRPRVCRPGRWGSSVARGSRRSAERVRVSRSSRELRQPRTPWCHVRSRDPGSMPCGVRSLVADGGHDDGDSSSRGRAPTHGLLQEPRRPHLAGAGGSMRRRSAIPGWARARRGSGGMQRPSSTGGCCSLQHNGYNDPQQVLGAPDAVNLGGKVQDQVHHQSARVATSPWTWRFGDRRPGAGHSRLPDDLASRSRCWTLPGSVHRPALRLRQSIAGSALPPPRFRSSDGGLAEAATWSQDGRSIPVWPAAPSPWSRSST